MCCKQLNQEIDTLVGLNIKFSEPIRNIYLREWIKNLRINRMVVDAKNMSNSELMVLLQNRACLQRVLIYPKHFDLMSVVTMLSEIDTLRELYISHACTSYMGFLPISVYQFSRLRRLHISLAVVKKISFSTAQFLLHVHCPRSSKFCCLAFGWTRLLLRTMCARANVSSIINGC